jgi:hypothetical protein
MTDEPLDPMQEARLRAAAEALPREIEPERDLWPDIRARIDADRVRPIGNGIGARGSVMRRRFPPGFLVTAAAAVLVIAVAATVQIMEVRTGRAVAAAAADRAMATVAAFERSSAELAATLERRGATLDPRTRAVLERSLLTIDGAIAEARTALDSDPSNPAVQAFVAAAYRQKLDFLRRANDVVASQGP